MSCRFLSNETKRSRVIDEERLFVSEEHKLARPSCELAAFFFSSKLTLISTDILRENSSLLPDKVTRSSYQRVAGSENMMR